MLFNMSSIFSGTWQVIPSTLTEEARNNLRIPLNTTLQEVIRDFKITEIVSTLQYLYSIQLFDQTLNAVKVFYECDSAELVKMFTKNNLECLN